uniref:Uncharacterized protein n=1 Tax=Dromaius novaehollandiae TaxID=8790 RepID=A0A8C4IY11_DRONO
ARREALGAEAGAAGEGGGTRPGRCRGSAGPHLPPGPGDPRLEQQVQPRPVQPASSVSGRGGAESQDRMRDSSAPTSASSSVADLCCTPCSSRSDLFLPSTAGDFSLSASLSACTMLYEVPSNR